MVKDAVTAVLKGAADWDGGRGLRNRRHVPAEEDSLAGIHPLLSASEDNVSLQVTEQLSNDPAMCTPRQRQLTNLVRRSPRLSRNLFRRESSPLENVLSNAYEALNQ